MTQLPVPYHQQDISDFCGPATAQMILEPIIGAPAEQGALEETMGNSNEIEQCRLGLTSPEQLKFGLNETQQKLGGPVRQFDAYYYSQQQDGTAALAIIVQTLQQGVAAAALVYGGGHWVAVTGLSMPPNDPNATAPDALFINNPWPPVPSSSDPPLAPPPPPPHADITDGCGGGGPRGQAEQVPISAWCDSYFTPVTMCRKRNTPKPLLGKIYIVVGAAGLAIAAPPSPVGAAQSGLAARPMPAARPMSKESAMIDPARAIELLRGAIERYGLGGREFDEAHFERPRIVEYLGAEDEAYYLIPLRWPDGSVLVGRVGAHRAMYLGAQLRPSKAIRANARYHLAEPREVEKWIREDHIRFESYAECDADADAADGGKRRASRYGVREELAWRPCAESRSPYYPFYQVTSGERTVGYIGLDRRPHSELNDLAGG